MTSGDCFLSPWEVIFFLQFSQLFVGAIPDFCFLAGDCFDFVAYL